MLFAVFLFVLSLITLYAFVRLTLWILIYKVEKLGNVTIKIGAIGLTGLKSISIKHHRSGGTVEIGAVWLTSCFINSQTKYPLGIFLAEIHFQLDLNTWQNQTGSDKTSSNELTKHADLIKYLSFLKYVSINVCDSSVALRNGMLLPSSIVYTSVVRTNVDFRVESHRFICNTSSDDLSIKLLVRNDGKEDGVLRLANQFSPHAASVALSGAVSVSLDTKRGCCENLVVAISKPSVSVDEDIFDLLASLSRNTVWFSQDQQMEVPTTGLALSTCNNGVDQQNTAEISALETNALPTQSKMSLVNECTN